MIFDVKRPIAWFEKAKKAQLEKIDDFFLKLKTCNWCLNIKNHKFPLFSTFIKLLLLNR